MIAPQVAMFWTELPVPLILSSPQCGEEKESQPTKAFGFSGLLWDSSIASVLLERIPSVPDVQSAWALLLHCANARANCALRDLARHVAQAHDAGLWRWMCAVLGVGEDQCDVLAKEAASLPQSLGGVGLRSAVRTSNSAFWASWADSLPMVRERHPEAVDMIVAALHTDPVTPILSAVGAAHTVSVGGFEPPSWAALSHGAQPVREPDVFEPGVSRRDWQHEAASHIEQMHRETWIFPRLTDSERAMLRFQSSPGAVLALSAVPSCDALKSVLTTSGCCCSVFALPPVMRTCPCGRPLDSFGHHRAACSVAGVLGRRGFALESVGARICREAGARVSTNVFVRDLDLLAPNARRLEIVAEGLPLFGGAQLAVDTTMVSAHHCDGTARAAPVVGVALTEARRRKERAYPELVGPRSRAKLVVLAGEVGERWSAETTMFLRLAAARARCESALLRRAEQAWRMRWGAMLAASAHAFAASLLEQRSNGAGDGDPPLLSDVLSDFRICGEKKV